MKNKLLYTMLFFHLLCSGCNIHSQGVSKTKSLPLLTIESEEIIPILDRCVGFLDSIKVSPDSVLLSISTQKMQLNNGVFYTMQISVDDNINEIFNYHEPLIGFINYNNYLIFIYNEESKTFFSSTENYLCFKYTPPSKGLLIIIDDSHPYWDYYYKNGEFLLIGESIPSKFRKK